MLSSFNRLKAQQSECRILTSFYECPQSFFTCLLTPNSTEFVYNNSPLLSFPNFQFKFSLKQVSFHTHVLLVYIHLVKLG